MPVSEGSTVAHYKIGEKQPWWRYQSAREIQLEILESSQSLAAEGS